MTELTQEQIRGLIKKEDPFITCRTCKNWDLCPVPEKQDWWEPGEIRYCEKQVLWLIKWVRLLDKWPPDGKETGYTGTSGKPVGYHAPFETFRCIIGELNYRLKRCGQDGKAFIGTILSDAPLDDDDRWVLGYICGNRRKRMGFPEWRTWKKVKKKGEV